MRETLAEWRETAHSAVQESPRTVAIVGVILLLLTAGVAAQATVTDTDDFEDQSAEGWSGYEEFPEVVESPGSEPEVGDYSIYAQTAPSGTSGTVSWDSGPALNTSEPFDVQATVRPHWIESDVQIRVGLASDSTGTEGENAFVLFDIQDGSTYLGTSATAPAPSNESEKIGQSFDDTWVNVRMNATGDGTLRAKVWPVGTAEPAEWQLTDEIDGATGVFGFNTGNGVTSREVWLDEVTISGTTAESEDLTLDTRSLFQPGATHPYSVYFEGEGDVTDNATVTSSNESILTVNEGNNTFTAINDSNVTETVIVQAQYNGEVASKEVVVAEPTVENLQILPGIWRFYAILDDSTMFALLIATLLSVPAARFTSAFGGLAVSEMVIVGFWFAGYIEYGFAAVSVFVAMFIGLNLAANIDYQVRR